LQLEVRISSSVEKILQVEKACLDAWKLVSKELIVTVLGSNTVRMKDSPGTH